MQVRLEFTFVVRRGKIKKIALRDYVQENGKFAHSILSSLEGQEAGNKLSRLRSNFKVRMAS